MNRSTVICLPWKFILRVTILFQTTINHVFVSPLPARIRSSGRTVSRRISRSGRCVIGACSSRRSAAYCAFPTSHDLCGPCQRKRGSIRCWAAFNWTFKTGTFSKVCWISKIVAGFTVQIWKRLLLGALNSFSTVVLLPSASPYFNLSTDLMHGNRSVPVALRWLACHLATCASLFYWNR